MKINHRQIIFAREYRQISQTELSKRIKGLSQSNLSKFEKGFDCLSDDIIEAIIKELNFPKAFFDASVSIYNKSETNPHYRKKAGLGIGEKNKIDYTCKLIGFVVDNMAENIEFPDFNIQQKDLDEGYTPKEIADYARKFFRLGDNPVVDIVFLLESCGIIVVYLDLNQDKFDGVSYISDGGYPVIVCNKNMSNDRIRYTLAHELGHLLMHASPTFIINEQRNVEVEADRFASQFLMPDYLIRPMLVDLKRKDLAELKRYWYTSMASIIRRAYDLGCIDKNKYTYYNIELSRQGYKKQEPITVSLDKPRSFYTAYQLHLDELGYSKEDFAINVKLPIDAVENLFNSPEPKLKIKQRRLAI